MGFEIDTTYNTFKTGILYMLKEKFSDVEYVLEDLTSLGEYSFANIPNTSQKQSYTFQNIQTIRDKKKEEEEYAKYCVEMDKAKKEYLALGGKKFIYNVTGRL